MSIYSCSIPSCPIPAISICTCTIPIFYGCGIHAHFDKPQSSHPCKKIYSEITSSISSNLDYILNEYDIKIDNSIQIASSTCTKLIKNIKTNYKNIISKYADLQRKIIEVRKLIKNANNVSILDNATDAEKIISSYIVNPRDNLDDWGEYKMIYTEEDAKNIILKNVRVFVDDSTIIVIPKAHSNSLMKIDALSYDINEVEVYVDEDFSYANGWCRLDDSHLFIYDNDYILKIIIFIYGGALSCISLNL
ncbi:hypothetical protein SteCoe_31240 [Stentor coeruleus]|uniref:Uncharacterized protein n=1 Tax=Stentor coeruleus TaxID=5963 RepID=A0A1R2B1Q3_9CILI|nr:hypothetical protein SteCoe_31240 [Stentor coeruleus]